MSEPAAPNLAPGDSTRGANSARSRASAFLLSNDFSPPERQDFVTPATSWTAPHSSALFVRSLTFGRANYSKAALRCAVSEGRQRGRFCRSLQPQPASR